MDTGKFKEKISMTFMVIYTKTHLTHINNLSNFIKFVQNLVNHQESAEVFSEFTNDNFAWQ